MVSARRSGGRGATGVIVLGLWLFDMPVKGKVLDVWLAAIMQRR
ncbi:hypothetical protein LA76x_1710 [Lysobacter antibioticus]|uniref:Uncharacterized protein n=1 Tax=Lysobacter antibioticus TaxID=84531 RepID=A0A0S2F8K1_LYSAN|nr:hypothetical protein LA76x_1710 [Lysobacter antibioticus]